MFSRPNVIAIFVVKLQKNDRVKNARCGHIREKKKREAKGGICV